MKHLLTLILAVISLSAYSVANSNGVDPMRDIEDRAAAGDPVAIIALRDSAECGDPRAMNFLGFLYWQGMGTRLDQDSALYFLREAASKGDAKASANLGHLLITGAETLQPDTVEALKLLDFAASRRSSAAIRELADYFDRHPGDSAYAATLKLIGDVYSHGFILPYNYRKALEYYDRAAQLGDTVAVRIIREHREIFPDDIK
ncbi:MAG: sel1 repeat family protein [Muribaculaceae bacterium]|nr:sel1 repeat family protein [Muribaculaceae bacterium]